MNILKPQSTGIPLPSPSALTKPFWDGCARGELWYQRCQQCGAAIFDPLHLCRFCRSAALEWQQSDGVGTVYSWSVVWRPQTPAFEVPYAVAIVELDDGYQMVSNIIGCEPDAIHLKMPVRVEFHDVGGGCMLPYFTPIAAP